MIYVRLLSRRDAFSEWKRRNSFGQHAEGTRALKDAQDQASLAVAKWQLIEPHTEFKIETSGETW